MQNITYPHDCACQISEVIDLPELALLKKTFNEKHKTLFERQNRVNVLQNYMDYECKNELMKEKISIAILNNHNLIKKTLNEPTFRCLEFLEKAGIPAEGSVIFTTNATADSANDNGIVAALKIMNCDKNITWEHTSNVTLGGFTGVSNKPPKHPPIKFDPHVSYKDWHAYTYSLAQQMFHLSHDEYDRYTHIYHWGCISQNWTKNPLGHYVSNWKVHEHWNHVLTMAMAWHGVACLKKGGQLILKVRIWRSAEMIGFCSLLAPMFKEFHIIDNAKQACSFAVVIFNDYDPTHRDNVLPLLQKCMSYQPSDIYGNSWFTQNIDKCTLFLKEAEVVRQTMIDERATTSTCFLVCLYVLHNTWRKKDKRSMYQIVQPLLIDVYGSDFGSHLFERLTSISNKMTTDDFLKLDIVMSSQWMHDNV